MTIDPAFYDLMPTEVTFQRYTGEDQWGNDSYGPGEVHRVRLETVTTTMSVSTQRAGHMTADLGTSTMVYVDYTEPPFGARDIVTTPHGVLHVVDSKVEYDERGPYYQALMCRNNVEA